MNCRLFNQLSCLILGIVWLSAFGIFSNEIYLLISNLFILGSFIIGGQNE